MWGWRSIWSYCANVKARLFIKNKKWQFGKWVVLNMHAQLTFSYLPLAFFTYQVINLKNNRQLLLAQVRDSFNGVLQSLASYIYEMLRLVHCTNV